MENPLSLDNRDISILTQVAFKEAVLAARSTAAERGESIDFTDEGTLTTVKVETAALFDVLADVVRQNQLANVGSAVQDASNVVRGAFPGTTTVTAADGTAEAPHPAEGGGFNLEVANPAEQQGPLEPWAVAKAQELGIRKVWDNRANHNRDVADGKPKPQPAYREFITKAQKDSGVRARGIWPPNR
jgi:hypothetical protein